MGKTYRSAQGKEVDMAALTLKHEMTRAVGNMNVNARGDQVGPGGQIIKSREEIVAEHYADTTDKKGNTEFAAQPDMPEHIATKNQQDEIPTSSKKVREEQPSGRVAEVETIDEKPGGLAGAMAKAKESKE